MESSSVKKIVDLEINHKRSLIELLEGIYSIKVNGELVYSKGKVGK